MASKYHLITGLYESISKSVSGNISSWQDFLSSAGYNYRLSYDEQLLLYAQKPDATAVLPIEAWNSKFHRWVNRGAKGIAVFDDMTGGRQRLKYYFDISDTHEGRYPIEVPIWEMKEEYTEAVIETLENTFGELENKENLGRAILSATDNAVSDNIADYLEDLMQCRSGSFLESLDEENVKVFYSKAVGVSIAFMMMKRLKIEPEQYIDFEDFTEVAEFNTKDTLNALGFATSDITKMALSEIARTVRALQMEKRQNRTFAQKKDRGYSGEKETQEGSEKDGYPLPDAGRLQPAEYSDADAGGSEPGKIRTFAESIPQGTQESDILQSVNFLQAGAAPVPDRAERRRKDAASDRGDESAGRDKRGAERKRYDEVGTDDEQHQKPGGGDSLERADLQLEYYDRKTEDKSLPFFHGEEEIRMILKTTPHLKADRAEIRTFYETHHDENERREYIKSIFNNDYTEIFIGDEDRRVGYKTYQNVLHLWEGSYLLRTSQGYYNWSVIADYFDSLRILGELFDDIKPLPSLEGQMNLIEDTKEEKDFNFSQEIIDLALTRGSGISEGKLRIYEQFQKSLSPKENIDFLKNEYGWGGSSSIKAGLGVGEMHDSKGIMLSTGYLEDADKLLLKWSDVEKRIAELIKLGRYLNPKEKEFYPAWIEERREPKELKESNQAEDKEDGFSKEESLAKRLKDLAEETDPYGFYDNFDEKLSQEEIIGEFAKLLDSKETVRDMVSSIRQTAEVAAADGDEELAAKAESLISELEGLYAEYNYALGDTVYIGAGEYEILSIDDKSVLLYDYAFPLINEEMKLNEFKRKVEENPSNDHLIVKGDIKKALNKRAVEPPVDAVIPPEEVPELPEQQPESHEGGPEPTEKTAEKPAEKELLPSFEQKPSQKQSHVLCPDVRAEDRLNYRITDTAVEGISAKERFNINVNVIKMLKLLEKENRLATAEEQEILAGYVGWGGLPEAFDDSKSSWADEYLQLKNLLTDDEYEKARESTLTAFYTPPVVSKAIYKALGKMGFQKGNILEPSCGIGSFFGLIPEEMQESKLYGAELDSITGRICRQLYQKATVAVKGYEDTSLPDSFFDIAIGNVPFGDFKVLDKRYDKSGFLIHDYFFAKTLDKVRPGGIIAFITSKGTMDKANESVRRYIAARADLIGGIRLPDDTFLQSAGTKVTSDIIFLQKRDKILDTNDAWLSLERDENGILMNRYFVEHPEMIAGKMVMQQGRFGMESTCIKDEDESLESRLDEAVTNLQAEITAYEMEEDIADEDDFIPADPDVRNFSYTIAGGELYFRENSRMNHVSVSVTAKNRIKELINLRECVRELIYYQSEDFPESDIKEAQERLNSLYDRFTKKYGLINSRANSSAFSMDSSYFLLCALEVLDEDGNLKRKADMFTKRTIKPHIPITSVDTSAEALAISLSEKAKIDISFMIELTGKTEEEIVSELKGVIFEDPEEWLKEKKKVYKAADEYLSGNVRNKLKVVESLMDEWPQYASNLEALKKVQPKDLSASEIDVRLGATWLPEDVVSQFIFELLDTPKHARWNIKVHYSNVTGSWNVEGKSYDRANIKAYNTYGTKRINAYKIIEETLNLKDVRIFDYEVDADGKRTAVLNKKETAIAKAKQQQIKTAFRDWIWQDGQRRNELTRLYNERFNSMRTREYDGSHIAFSGMNPEIRLKEHQVNAVARILYGGNTLLAHVVGAGKTFEMVAAAMESKRLGLCSKSLFVVPNHLTEQWAAEFMQLYPAANILVSTKKDFEKKNRRKFCGRIATGDFDAVIIGHSQFEKIPMSIERQRIVLQQQRDEIVGGINELKQNRGERFSIKQLEKTKKAINIKLEKLNDQSRKDDVVTFEELGVDRIFIDESHHYKNLFLYSKMRNVGGIAQTEAQKSSDLFMKCRYLDEITGGKGIVFATGTPISNSMVELYTIQRYLQYDLLQKNHLQHFDAWASTFGETVTAIELSPEGTGYRAKTRFAKFYNLPELMTMFKEAADIKTSDMLNLPVPKAIYENVAVSPSKMQEEMVTQLSERAEKVRNKMVAPNEDNMLKITNDGRKLALDQRLINDMLPDYEDSKLNACVDNIYRIWEEGKEKKLTQLVFSDLSTPKNDGSFNVYDDIRSKLVEKGVPAEEVKFIHEASSEAKKKELFGKIRKGDVRVLLGSTAKMGAGTNVQDRLIALHDLDCPWRPSDLEQRSGRIIRQGNSNPKVSIFRYVTEGTFDAYLYQLVENKQKFISQIMTSKSPVRSAEDVDETALSYAEIKMLAMSDPRIKEKMDLDIKVAELKVLKQSYLSEKYALEDRLVKYYPQEITALQQKISAFEDDISFLAKQLKSTENSFCGMSIGSFPYTEKKEAGLALLDFCKKMKSPASAHMGQYCGFDMKVSFDTFDRQFTLSLKHCLSHQVTLGDDVYGNITRIDNVLDSMPDKLSDTKIQLEDMIKQQQNAQEEILKPFIHEGELKEKMQRLEELNIALDVDKREDEEIEEDSLEEGCETPERKQSEQER